MSRYFSRKLLLVHLMAVLAITSSLLLANWQWKKAHFISQVEVTNNFADFKDLSPLRDYLPPSAVGVQTKVSGTWLKDSRLEFSNRPRNGDQLLKTQMLNDELGTWVMDILKLSDGSNLGVVRGFAPVGIKISMPSGSATLTGVMQPSENTFRSSLKDLPSLITTDIILDKSNATVHDGYFISSTKSDELDLVKPILSDPQKVKLHWRNVIYTGNWIIFALIFAGMWWRVIQMETTPKVRVDEWI